MNRFAAVAIVCTLSAGAIQGCWQGASASAYSLDLLQGGWWSDCNDPAVEFRISGSQYSGDFEGSYKVTLSGDVLVFNDGLTDGHSIGVTHNPLSFQILNVTDKQLILRPLSGKPGVGEWHLESCKNVTPNN